MSGDYADSAESAVVQSILRPLLNTAHREGRFRTSMEIKPLFSRYCQDKGDIPTALKWLSEALKIAAPEGFLRLFLDEAPVLELLPQARETAPDLVVAILGQHQSADDVARLVLSEVERLVLSEVERPVQPHTSNHSRTGTRVALTIL